MKKAIIISLLLLSNFHSNAHLFSDNKKEFYQYGEYAFVRMKDKSLQKVMIIGCRSKRSYWVRDLNTKRQGWVHIKHLSYRVRAQLPKIVE